MTVTDEMIDAFVSRSSVAPGDMRQCVKAGLEAALSASPADLAFSSEKFTQDELHKLFPDGIPMVFVKLLFPEKSEGLTVGELRQIARALAASPAGVGMETVPEGWTVTRPTYHKYPHVVQWICGEWHLRKHHGNGAAHTVSTHATHTDAIAALKGDEQ